MIGELFCFLIWYLSLFFKILLVTNENSRDVFLSVLVYFTHPLRDLSEGITVGDIISDDDTMSTLIITTSDSLEPFLTCSIPNLELNGLSINVNSSNFEVYTNGWHEIIIENVIL